MARRLYEIRDLNFGGTASPLTQPIRGAVQPTISSDLIEPKRRASFMISPILPECIPSKFPPFSLWIRDVKSQPASKREATTIVLSTDFSRERRTDTGFEAVSSVRPISTTRSVMKGGKGFFADHRPVKEPLRVRTVPRPPRMSRFGRKFRIIGQQVVDDE